MRYKALLVYAALVMAPVFCFAQNTTLPIDSATQKVTYTAVVQAGDLTKDEIYNRAKEWIATKLKASQNAILLDDKDAGRLAAKANIPIDNYLLGCTINIWVKDGRYKYSIADLEIITGKAQPYSIESTMAIKGNLNADGSYKERYLKFLAPIERSLSAATQSLSGAIQHPVSSSF